MSDPVKHISSKDLDSHVKELDTIQVGIRDDQPKDEFVRIKPDVPEKEDLKESYDEIEGIAKYAVRGNDYHEDLEAVHKNVPKNPHFTPAERNVRDSLIHDILKKGKPDGETASRVFDIISKADNDSGRTLNKLYLQTKWKPLIDQHAEKWVPKHESLDDAAMSKEEINSIPKSYSLDNGRYLIHDTGTVFYKHPTKGIMYVGGHIPKGHEYAKNRGMADTHNESTRQSLHAHYEQFDPDPAVKHYSEGSGTTNTYLHKKHVDEHAANQSIPPHLTLDDVTEHIDGVSNFIKNTQHQTHMPDFHVYTGMYVQSNPETAHHKDEDGNLIVHNPSFTSTSLNRKVALSFAGLKRQDGYEHPIRDVMKIRVPGGYPLGAYIAPHSSHEDEQEYLLDKAHSFKIKPTPKMYIHDQNPYREWEAELHHHTPEGDFDKMNKVDKVLSVIHPDAKPEHLHAAVHDSSIEVQAAAAKHPRLSPELQHHIFDNGSTRVLESLLINPNLDHGLLNKAISEDGPEAKAIARRKNLSQEHISKLANSNYFSVQAEVAKRPDLSHEHFADLAKTENDSVHLALASNTKTPGELLDGLANHPKDAIRQAVAKNSEAPVDTLRKLASDTDSNIRYHAKWNPVNFRFKGNSNV